MTRAREIADLGNLSVPPPKGKNLLYNGAMQVAQRGKSTESITTAGYHTLDRFRTVIDVMPGVWTQSQDTNTPDGFGSSLRMTCTTADSSLTANEALLVEQYLEGQDLQHLQYGTASAKSLTLSFWVRSNVTGTYALNFRERDNNYLIASSYSIDASDTWEYKTVTIPGLTLGPGIDNDNGLGFSVHFWLAAGPSYTSGTLQTSWGSYSTSDRAVGQANLASAINNYWQVTGVQLEVGETATEFEHLPFGDELMRCQRYYQKTYEYEVEPGTVTSNGLVGGGDIYTSAIVTTARRYTNLVAPMRVVPNVVLYDTAGTAGKVNLPDTRSNITAFLVHPSYSSFGVEAQPTSYSADGRMYFHYTVDAEL